MKILAIDTATPGCGVGVADGQKLLAEITTDSKETHSTRLMPMIRSVLDLAGMSVSEMDGFAVSVGPGSFTGLRIGVSAVKGLAAAAHKPVVGVRTSDALAFQFPYPAHLICTLTDARKGQVYCARFRFRDGRMTKETDDRVLNPEDAVRDISEPCLFVGTGAVLYRSVIIQNLNRHALFPPSGMNIIRAGMIAMLSLDRFERNDADDPADLVPFYVRTPDADVQAPVRPDNIK